MLLKGSSLESVDKVEISKDMFKVVSDNSSIGL